MAAEEYAIHVDGLTREEWEGAVRRDRYAVLASQRVVPLGGDRFQLVQDSEYIETLERAVLAWRSELRAWMRSDYPPSYLTVLDERMATSIPVTAALLEKYPEP